MEVEYSQNIDGWTLTEGPPKLTGYEGYGANPGPLIKLASVQFASIPFQTITPTQSTSDNLAVTSHGGVGQWDISSGTPLDFNLTTPFNCDVTLEITIQGSPGSCGISVNGNNNAYTVPYRAESSTQTVTISNSDISVNSGTGKGNVNKFSISQIGIGGCAISSISISSTKQTLKAHAQWFQLDNGTVPESDNPNTKVDLSKSTTYGCTTSNTESQTLSKSLNISASISPGGILKVLGLGLTVGFKTSSSRTQGTGIDISKSTTYQYTGTVAASKKGKKTYQLYQLKLIYSDGVNLVSINQQTYILNSLLTKSK